MKELLAFVNGDLLRDTAHRVDEHTPLFEDGLIDSLKILKLIAYVEWRTGRSIPNQDVVMSNFRSVQTIADRFLHEHD
jgi:acyl carrier protein